MGGLIDLQIFQLGEGVFSPRTSHVHANNEHREDDKDDRHCGESIIKPAVASVADFCEKSAQNQRNLDGSSPLAEQRTEDEVRIIIAGNLNHRDGGQQAECFHDPEVLQAPASVGEHRKHHQPTCPFYKLEIMLSTIKTHLLPLLEGVLHTRIFCDLHASFGAVRDDCFPAHVVGEGCGVVSAEGVVEEACPGIDPVNSDACAEEDGAGDNEADPKLSVSRVSDAAPARKESIVPDILFGFDFFMDVSRRNDRPTEEEEQRKDPEHGSIGQHGAAEHVLLTPDHAGAGDCVKEPILPEKSATSPIKWARVLCPPEEDGDAHDSPPKSPRDQAKHR